MYILLSIIAATVFISMHLYLQTKNKRIAEAQTKAIELNQKVIDMIELVDVISIEKDEEILNAIMSCQELNFGKFAKAKAGIKYIDWQFAQTQLQMDLYFKKVENILYKTSQEK